MKLIVKTLKGDKFPIEVETSSTVEQIKGIIVRNRNERFEGSACVSSDGSCCHVHAATKSLELCLTRTMHHDCARRGVPESY